jgi:hypothetical protein
VILASRSVVELQRLRDGAPTGPLFRHLTYTLQLDELWERSYAQYIVVRSGDAGLRAELDERRQLHGSPAVPYLWEDDDFGPVAAEIDRLFRRLGWIR